MKSDHTCIIMLHWILWIMFSFYIWDCDASKETFGLPRPVASCNPDETCVEVRACPTFIELLRTQGRHLETTEELRQKNCGFWQEPLKICCPSLRISHDPEHLELSECGQSKRTDSVVVSQNITLGDWPWAVALGSNSSKHPSPSFHCAGALISRDWVLASAHCIGTININASTFVRLGVTDLKEPVDNEAVPVDIGIDQIIRHPQYSTKPKIVNNIALIHLKEPVHYTKNIRRICLPKTAASRMNEYYFERFPTILGWNITNGQNITWKLQETRNNVVEHKKCAAKYTINGTTLINELALCTENLKGDHCQADPGALLILPNTVDFRQYLEGIASYGFGCSSEHPKVFTRVAQFVDWIRETISEKTDK